MSMNPTKLTIQIDGDIYLAALRLFAALPEEYRMPFAEAITEAYQESCEPSKSSRRRELEFDLV